MCHVCRNAPAIGREHLPAKGAANTGKVQIKFIDGTQVGGGVFHQHLESNDGFWVQALCKKCNEHRTGSRLGSAYAAFVEQVSRASGIEDEGGRIYVRLADIYPLRIIKQMFSMFLCAMPQQPLPAWRNLQDFVYNKDEKLPPDAPKVYLYLNTSEIGRIVPWCAIAEICTRRNPIALSEISWPPVGIIYCEQGDERFDPMENITGWGQYSFKDKKNLVVQLPRLRVNTDHPLAYGSLSEIEKWRTDCGIIWAVAGADGDYESSPNNTSMVWQRSEL